MEATELPSLPVETVSFLNHINTESGESKPLRELIQPYLKYESKLRALFAQDPSNAAIADNTVGLVPIYEGQEANIKIQARDLAAESEIEKSKYMMELDKDMRKETGDRAIVNLEEFERNFGIFTEGALLGLDWTNIVAAGSSVLTPILPVPKKYKKNKRTLRDYYHTVFAPTSDIDLFIYGTKDEEVAIQRMKEIEATIRGNLLWEATCVRTKNTITIVSQYPNRHIQIVLRLYSSISEILTGFDVSCACVAYDGKQVYASPRAVVSWMLQCNDIDLTRRSPSYEFRLAKYRKRGFEIYYPDLQRNRIDPTIYERNIIKLQGLSKLLLLEKLPEAQDRDAYLADRRNERGQPMRSSRRSRRSRRKMERLQALRNSVSEVPEWDFSNLADDQSDESNYATITIPYGEGYTAHTIQELIYESDMLLNEKHHKPLQEHRAAYLHRHPAFIGPIKYIVEDCCEFCPEPQDDEEKALQAKDDRFFVRGRIAFLRDDPGRQEIGSFNPLTEDDWTKMAYLNENEMLYRSIAANNIPAIKEWIAEGKEINKRDHTGRTALHLACLSSSIEVIKLLIDSGVKISRRLGDGRTALHIAAARGDAEIVKLLLLKSQENEELKAKKEDEKKRAAEDPQDGKKEGQDDEAVANESDDETFDVVSGRESVSARTRASSFVEVKKKTDDETEDSSKEEADDEGDDILEINVTDWDYKMSPLHYAILNSHQDIIKMLVSDFGADVLQPIKGNHDLLPLPLVIKSLDEKEQGTTLQSLLKLGASCAQTDSNKTSAFMHILKQGTLEHLKILFEEDGASALTIAKRITVKVSWNPSIDNSLLTAISQGEEDKALFLLEQGVAPEITFDALLSSISGKMDKDAKDKLQRHFKDSFRQPAELALRMKLFKVFRRCIELGVEPSSYTAGGHPTVDTSNSYNRNATKACTLLDKIHKLITSYDEEALKPNDNSGFGSKKSNQRRTKRKLRQLATMPKQLVEGSYNYWMASQLLANENKRREEENDKIRKENNEIEEQNAKLGEPEPEEKTEVRENPYRELADWLVSKGGKAFQEDFLKITYQFGRSWAPDENFEDKNKAYHELYQAVWDGDQDKLTRLTSEPWDKQLEEAKEGEDEEKKDDETEEEDPLLVSTPNQLGYNLFSIAVYRKHPKDFLDLILSIAERQNTPSKVVTVTFDEPESEPDSEGDEDSEAYSESESESENDDTENQGKILSTTTPTQLLNQRVPFVLDGKLPTELKGNNYSLTMQAAIIGDIETFKYLVSTREKYKETVVFDCQTNPNTFTETIASIRYENLDIMREVLKNNGFGAFAEEKTTVTQEPGWYMGLSIKGKKRNGWENDMDTSRRSFVINDANYVSAGLLAAYYGSIKSYEWLEKEGAQVALDEYIRRQKESEEPKLDVDIDTFNRWLGINNSLLLHSLVLNESLVQSKKELTREEKVAWYEERIKFFISKNPDLLESKDNEDGLTPLLLAAQRRNKPALEALINCGADMYAYAPDTNSNVVHMILHRVQRKYNELEDYFSLLPQDVKSWAFAQRALYNEIEYTPLAYMLHDRQETSWYRDIEMSVNLIPLVLKHSGKVELGIRTTLGDLPVHIAAQKSSVETLQIIVDSCQPKELVTENSNGVTVLEIARTSWYQHVVGNSENTRKNSRNKRKSDDKADEELEKKRKPFIVEIRHEEWGFDEEDPREIQVLKMLDTAVKRNSDKGPGRVLVTVKETNEKVERLEKRQKGGKIKYRRDILSQW